MPAVQAATPPRVALVLGGGGARGLAHVGVLKVLEEAHVPIACIVGTSMGSLVAGGYAVGRTPEELEARILKADWDTLISTQPPRTEILFRDKEDDRPQVVPFAIGISDDGKLGLPKAVISTQRIEGFLREMTLAGTVPDFDHLSIPYRAIASDIETGQMVVLKNGDIVTAMRASMAVPGVFPSVLLNGQTLVDGGISRNLPIDIARQTCHPDVVIAVDVGAPPLKSKQIGSMLDVADQLTRLLIAQNVEQQIKTLTPSDLLIMPDFGTLGSMDFNKTKELLAAGEAAARAKLDVIQRYAVAPEQYRAWLIARQDKRLAPKPIDRIEMGSMVRVNPEVVRKSLDIEQGTLLDNEKLATELGQLYASGDFSRLNYDLTDNGKGQILKLVPIEKDWGPNYLSFGVSLGTDFDRNNPYNLTARYRRSWLNSLGGDWQAAVRVGNDKLVGTELYQPLRVDSAIFVSPYVAWRQRPIAFWLDDNQVAEYQYEQDKVGIDFGSSWTRFGEVRLGLLYQRAKLNQSIGTIPVPNQTQYDYGLRFSAGYDQLDQPNFPTSGQLARVYAYHSIGSGGDFAERVDTVGFRATQAAKFGDFAGHITVKGHFESGDSSITDLDWLGGLLNLSSYHVQELIGDSQLYGRASIYTPFAPFGQRLGNVGFALEAGQIYNQQGISNGGWHYSTTAFWGMDSYIGPLFLTMAYGDNKKSRFYFALGNPF
ncbi:patatin-like phospholipase family protein [Andreprevotia sp. IGB-42]|uniref:patatin-like phospholipase family protein n=1 Tax=Andreprevotia sp. IGB-42 TaxID=2497473 RepID=UPI001359592D|nr:patatin-like phospholipase family protein [Andreprevotia sp. IGB-42]